MDQIKKIKLLKDGGQKKVYLASHSQIGNVVIKVGKCNSTAALERIKREVELLRGIDSIYFPKNYEFKYNNSGEFHIVEEYIKSNSLNEVSNQFESEKKISEFALKLIDGMKVLWERRIVHRDLKPDNILIRPNLCPVIIDLGIARILEGDSLTKSILNMGPCTPNYASPEQLNNKKTLIDMRTDFFSIGIILAELFLNKHPFSPEIVGEGISIVENIEASRYKLEHPTKKMSSRLEVIIKKLLENKTFNRFRTYQQFQEELKKIV